MTDPQSKTIRTILKTLADQCAIIGHNCPNHNYIPTDGVITGVVAEMQADYIREALSDISKIIDEAKPDEIDEILNTAISHAITDGQNQIHDLKDGKATPEEISTRMEVSYKYHTKMTKAKLLALKSKWEKDVRLHDLVEIQITTLLINKSDDEKLESIKEYVNERINQLTNGDK